MKKLLLIVVGFFVVVFLLLVGANLYIKHYLNSEGFRSMLTEQVEKATERKMELGEISYSLLPPSIVVRDVALMERDGSEAFVSLKEFSLLVDLGKREVSSMLLLKPSVRIVEYADGHFNFSDMIPKTSTHTETGSDTAAAPAQPAEKPAPAKPVELKETELPFSIAKISIEDAAFNFIKVDADQQETAFTIPSLDFTIQDVVLDKPIRIDLAMQMGGASSMKSTLAIGPLRTMPPDIANMGIQMEGMFDLASFKDLEVFLSPKELAEIPMTAMDFAWKGEGTLSSGFTFDLTIKTPPVDERNKLFLDLNNSLTMSLPEAALNHLLYQMPLPADMAPPAVPEGLSEDELCLTRDPMTALLFSTLQLQTRITTPKLAYEKNEITDLDVVVNIKQGELTLFPLKFKAFGGTVAGKAGAGLTDCPLSYTLNTFDINNVQLADIIQANKEVFEADLFEGLSGRVEMHADMSGRGNQKSDLERFLQADGKLQLVDGQSISTGGSFLDKMYLKLDNPLLIELLPELKREVVKARANATNETITKLENVIVDFTMKEGTVNLTQFQLGTPDYLLTSTGTVKPFADRLYLEAQLNLSEKVTMELTDGEDLSESLPYENGGLIIPLIIQGTLDDPIPLPNLDKMLTDSVKKEISNSVKNALDGVFGIKKKDTSKKAPKPDSTKKAAEPEEPTDEEQLVEQGLGLFNSFLKGGKSDN